MAKESEDIEKAEAPEKEMIFQRQRACANGVCAPQRTQGLRAPAPQGQYNLVHLLGDGIFLAAQITKQGGSNGLTFVNLEIDGRNVTSLSFAAARNWGLIQQNPYGIVYLDSPATETLAIGFPTPLAFRKELILSANVREANVVQILANVIHGD